MKKELTQKGFTLIETLVAIFLITVAITATLSSVQLSLQSSFFARDQITAFYLAEEAVEQVRNIRDANYVVGKQCDWLHNTDASCFNIPVECSTQTCRIDVVSNPNILGIESCSGNQCILNFDAEKGYNHTTGTVSKFTRTIQITERSDHEIVITASVSWGSGFGVRSTVLREVLFNWRGR